MITPRTEAGKARSSQNACSSGLFSAKAFIRPEETEEYEQLRGALMAELAPKGVMEQSHATEILNSMWRQRRCQEVEASLLDDDLTDPMANPELRPAQQAVDRARAHAGNTIRRSTAELRRLQTERLLQKELGENEGLASHKDAAGTRISETRRAALMTKLEGLDTLESLLMANESAARKELFPAEPEPAPNCGAGNSACQQAFQPAGLAASESVPLSAEPEPAITKRNQTPQPPPPFPSRDSNGAGWPPTGLTPQ